MVLPDKTTKSSLILTLASIAVVVAALYLAKSLLIPLALAVLLSFMLSPVCDWLERRGVRRVPAVLMTASLGFTLIGVLAWTATVQIAGLAPQIPEYQHNLAVKFKSVNEYAVAALSKVTGSDQGMQELLSPAEQGLAPLGTNELPFSVRVLSSPPSPLQIFGGVFGNLLVVLGTTGIVVVLVVYFLVRREDMRDRFIHLVGKGHVTMTIQTLEDAATRVSRFLSMLFVVNATFGIAVGIGLYLIGLPNAVLWGILAAVLRFIPYIGPWIGAVMPIGLSMAISTGWQTPLLTVGLFVALELFSNNVMEPWLYGKSTGVSAVAVLLAAVFWMWLWGPAGLLLATPLTVCLLVVGKHVSQLSFLGILLGNEPVFEPHTRVYQRLLAGDQEEAVELLDEYLRNMPLADVYDIVLIPALALTETHGQLGELNEGKHKFILQSLRDMIQDRIERQHEMQALETTKDSLEKNQDADSVDSLTTQEYCVLSLPARSEADEVAAMMLAQVLETKNCIVQAVSITSLASETVTLVERRNADVICISATPPGAVMHARYLCKELRHRFPTVNLVVGLWGYSGDWEKARERIGYNTKVVATMAEAQEQVRLLIRKSFPETEPPSQQEYSEMVLEEVHS